MEARYETRRVIVAESPDTPPSGAERAGNREPNEKRPVWTPEDKRFLKENFKTMSDGEIADRLGRSARGVSHMRNRLGLGPSKRAPAKGSWTKEMDATVQHNPDMPIEDLARLLKRTPVAVTHRRQHLGLTKSRSETYWKPREDSVLLDNPDKHPKWLAEKLENRTEIAIRARRLALGLPPYVVKHDWEDQDLRTLKDNLQAPMSELARLFPDKSYSAIRGTARKLGRKRIRRQGYTVSNGYITKYEDGRSVLAHHAVVEREIGRKLRPREVVHHINCDRGDNRPENLDLLQNSSAHADVHASFQRLLPDLLGAGVVRYDEGRHSYEVARHE